jgi:hypothetical protein
MVDKALDFIASELNAYLRARTGSITDKVNLTPVVDESGKYAIDEDSIGISIINIEEDRVVKDQLRDYKQREGMHISSQPRLKLNLFVMCAANFKKYDQALKYLTHILTFFQARPVFTQQTHPGLGEDVERLVIELQKLNYDQLNQIWAFVGGKQLPSVVYRIGMVSLQDESEISLQPPIKIINPEIESLEAGKF